MFVEYWLNLVKFARGGITSKIKLLTPPSGRRMMSEELMPATTVTTNYQFHSWALESSSEGTFFNNGNSLDFTKA